LGPRRERLTKQATDFLVSSGRTTLLEHSKEYRAIPENYLGEFAEKLEGLLCRVAVSSTRWRGLSLAASFLSQRRLVMWDFFAPSELDTTGLSLL
jgi:hypothetical protein